jgi:hypothetical protein
LAPYRDVIDLVPGKKTIRYRLPRSPNNHPKAVYTGGRAGVTTPLMNPPCSSQKPSRSQITPKWVDVQSCTVWPKDGVYRQFADLDLLDPGIATLKRHTRFAL